MSDLLPQTGAWGADRVHRFPVRVYYEDTDFSGVVYHARYLHFFERARTESLRAIGLRHAELASGPDPVAFAVRRIAIEYIRAARVDDALLVETRYRPQQGARLMMDQSLIRGAEPVATAAVEAVIMTLEGRPRRPPPTMTGAWAPYVIARD